MKKDSTPHFGHKEKYFLSDVYSQGEIIAKDIRSKLIFNDMKYIEAMILLYPPKERLHEIDKFFELEIKGYFEYVDGGKAGEIHIPKGYRISSGCTSFASTWDECTVKIAPAEIYQKDYLKGQEEDTKKETHITFSLTDNKKVRPWGIVEWSFKGNVTADLRPRVILNFSDDWIVKFEQHYRYLDTKLEEVDGTFLTSRLVLTLEKSEHQLKSVNEVMKISDLVDTLLWYLSFGSRQRTTWIEWTAEIGTEYIEYYRRVSLPREISDYEEPLVDNISIQEFLQHCLEYEKREKKLNLYLPIIYLVGADEYGKTIEMEFLSLFMALEALLDLYAESRNKNKHFPDEIWSHFYAYMKKAIKEFPDIEDEDKSLMLEKLGIFNQTSMKFLYFDFCKEMKIDNSDLWPLYGTHLDLSRIRNKLIHGKRFESWPLISIAIEHLRWIVERCLLAVLGWKEKTEVYHALRKYTAYRDWKSYYEER